MKTQLETAKELISYLTNYTPETKQIIDIEGKEKLRTFYIEVFKQIPNLCCHNNLVHYLTQVQAWFERESQQQPAEQPQPEMIPAELPKGCKKCGKNKTK